MNIAELIENAAAQVIEPEAGTLCHAADYGSFEERMKEAETDYAEAKQKFESMDAGSRYIMDTAARANEAGRVLLSRALTLYNMVPSSQENKKYALDIIDMVTKDTSKREQTCSQYYRFMKEANPTAEELVSRILKEKQNVMHFLDRCIRTQSVYINKFKNDKDVVDPIQQEEIKAAIKGERERACVPEGSSFKPPMPFPPERTPAGKVVPSIPDPYKRFVNMDPTEKVFNVEHHNFEIPEGYISEDGLIDSESVVFDYENHLVTMKYRGGVPVTWPFKQFIDTREVPRPDEWFSEYMMRLWDKAEAEMQMGVFLHRSSEEEVPDYNKIPNK